MRWVRVVGLGLLLAVVQASAVEAQDPYSCLDELEEAELDARLALVDQRLQAHKLGARLWWWLSSRRASPRARPQPASAGR